MSTETFFLYFSLLLCTIFIFLQLTRLLIHGIKRLFGNVSPPAAKTIRSKNKGYVYCLSNPSMPRIVKIGFTKHTPQMRAHQLYKQGGSGIPQPYVVEFYYCCKHPQQAEQAIHKELQQRRVAENREFFNVSIRKAKKAFRKHIPRPRTYYS